MLREDGMVFDDGTTARMGENEYVMTTTTANAVTVFRHLEFCRQCLWPDMDVQLISTTEAWAQFSVAGPNARKLLEKLVDQDISDAAFPYMGAGRSPSAAGCGRGCSGSASRASWPMRSPCPPAMAMR
jgi:glycine cleavage system aminomethyltransferase T